ncbi:efflux RND transporter periplasmic adaptor subunit [Pontiella sp.]|uniref:efflux RND transporter periplasmic adaptor subunit n=1 Tax=Pontiella sp. TaxID=2837462 RepID=UPI0035661FD8
MSLQKNTVRILLAVLAVGLLLLIVVLAMLKPAEKPLPADTEAAVPVSTLTVELTSTPDTVFLPALIEANVNATLAAEKAGRIVQIKVDRGDRVEKDQLLLQIDDRIWQANLKQANIAATDARKNHERFKQLQASGAVADSEFDSIEAASIRAEAMATEAEINIEQCRVESPIAGTVNDRYVEEGEYVQPGTPVFQVVDTATLKVVAQIPEKDIYSIHVGQPIRFTIQPLKGRTFEGRVTFVAAQADGRNNAFRTEITVDNSDGTLRPGMIAQVEFQRGLCERMVSLPMSAVLPSKGDHIVYLAVDGQAVRRKVHLEAITRERALIYEGLEQGEIVITEGNRTLSDGQRIEIVEEGSAR